MNQRPVAVGLLLCEQIIVEQGTRNITPVNCFTHRSVDHFPSEPFPFIAFAFLTDGLGVMPLTIVIQRLDSLEEIYRAEALARFTSPLQSFRCTLRIRECSFPEPGHYQVMLLAEGEMVAQRTVVLLQKESQS